MKFFVPVETASPTSCLHNHYTLPSSRACVRAAPVSEDMARHPRTLKAKGHPGFLGLQAVGCNHFPDSNHGKQAEVSGTRHRGKGCQRDLAALTHNLTYCRSVALTQA